MIAGRAKLALGGALAAAALTAAPAAATADTRYVRTSGSDGNAVSGCASPAQACLTIGGAVNAPATTDGDTIDIGPGSFSAPTAPISETLAFVGNGPGEAGSAPDATTTVIDAGAGPQEGLKLLAGGSVSDLRLEGADGGGFSEALVLGTNDAGDARTYTISNVVATGGEDPTSNVEPAVLVTDAGAPGGNIDATVSGYFEAGGLMPANGPGVVGATGMNVSATVRESELIHAGGNVAAATVTGGAALALRRSVAPAEGVLESVLSMGPGSELTIDRSRIVGAKNAVLVRDTAAGPPGQTRIRDSILVSRPTFSAPEGEHALLAVLSNGGGTLDVDVGGSTIAAVGPDVESGLHAIAGTNTAVVNVTASNSIFRARDTAPAPDGSARDVRAIANLGLAAPATVTLNHSSYSTVSQPAFGGITAAGSGSNVSGNPGFADELGHDLALTAASPLLDAGAVGVSGPLDFAGAAREQDADCDGITQPDIGAFERMASCPPPPGPGTSPDPNPDPSPSPNPEPERRDTDPPETAVRKAKVKGDDVKLRFGADEPGATFVCKLDRKKRRPCTSPKAYRNLDDGRHRFAVTATDPAGNTDPTAAKTKFEVNS